MATQLERRLLHLEQRLGQTEEPVELLGVTTTMQRVMAMLQEASGTTLEPVECDGNDS